MFKRILLPIDLQETGLADKAVEIAIDQAHKYGADIYVMTVLPGFGMPMVATFFPEKSLKKALKEIGAQLKRFIAEKFPKEINIRPVIAEGNPAECILSQRKKLGADLIIVPSTRQSLGHVFLGSSVSRVVEHANCSVMVIKGK